jgi:sugar O-acyltransferase (sialic acid O-acetyltransferase NeuD family)
MTKKVIILGGLGNGTVIASAIKDANKKGDIEIEVAGFLNDRTAKGESIEGLPVLGKLDDIQKFISDGFYFVNTIFKIDGQKERIKLVENLNIPIERLATFIHPTAYIASQVEIGPGCIILPNVCISPSTKLGKGCIVLTAATIAHNCEIGDHCHIASQACLGSHLKIGEGVHFGLNCTIREHLTIGQFSTIGMGAILLNNVGEDEIWVGVPAKFLRKTK